jgi:hypothetical protein
MVFVELTASLLIRIAGIGKSVMRECVIVVILKAEVMTKCTSLATYAKLLVRR